MHDASMSCLAAHKLISGILQRKVIRFFRLPSYWFQVTFTQTIHHEEPILSILYPYLEMSKIATALVEYIKQSANNSDFCFAFRQAVCRVGRLCFCFRNGIKYVVIPGAHHFLLLKSRQAFFFSRSVFDRLNAFL